MREQKRNGCSPNASAAVCALRRHDDSVCLHIVRAEQLDLPVSIVKPLMPAGMAFVDEVDALHPSKTTPSVSFRFRLIWNFYSQNNVYTNI